MGLNPGLVYYYFNYVGKTESSSSLSSKKESIALEFMRLSERFTELTQATHI